MFPYVFQKRRLARCPHVVTVLWLELLGSEPQPRREEQCPIPRCIYLEAVGAHGLGEGNTRRLRWLWLPLLDDGAAMMPAGIERLRERIHPPLALIFAL